MTINTFSWLHLTDFHFGLKNQKFLWENLHQPFFDDLEELLKQTGPIQAVLFTGDLVQQGTSDEFREMQKVVLDTLFAKLKEFGSGDAVLLAVPGNHDLFRPKKGVGAVDMLLLPNGFNNVADTFWNNELSDYRRVVNDSFAAYTEWWDAAQHRPKNITQGILPGDFAHTLNCVEHKIGIIGLNTAFLQLQAGDYRRKLVWDMRQLHAVCEGTVQNWLNRHSVCMLLTHQGPDWLTPEAKKHGENEIAPTGRFALHLFGHEHKASYSSNSTGGNGAVRRYLGSSVFGMELYGEPPAIKRDHGYAVGRITFNETHASLKFFPRIAHNDTQNNGWQYIPDISFKLPDGISTAPETIPLRGKTITVPETEANPTASPSRKPAPHSTLPQRHPFFGRADELEKIATFLQPDYTGWGVVLDGPGGIGKTSLAVEAAHRAPAERFPLKLFITAKKTRMDVDGERELHDGRVEDYFNLLTEIGLALGHDEAQRTPEHQRAELVRHALSAQRALLVLDNLESFSREERRRIYDLLERLPPTCRAIVTSRRRDETTARTLRLDKLDFAATRQLFAALRECNLFLPSLTEAEQQRLYDETNGNPLLLTWTAGQLGRVQGRCRTVDQAVERLIEAHKNKDNDPLEFVFGDLLDTFTDNETKVLAALAFFAEPARLAWLLPLAELSKTAALTALDDLRDRALLQEDEINGLWYLPPLAARFLRLRRPEAISFAGQRLENEAYALAVRHGGRDNYPFTELEAHWATVEAALPLLIAGDNTRLQAVCDALFQFLNFTGRWNERLGLSRQAEAKALAAGDHNNAGARAYNTGWVHYLQGDGDRVLDCAERCAEHWRLAGADARQQAIAIRLRGIAYQLQKDYPAAITAYQQALELWRSLNPESQDVTSGLCALASAKKEAGDLDGAELDYREALRIAEKILYREGIAAYTGNLAGLALDRRDWPAAENLAQETLTLSKAIGRLEMIARDHHTLALALLNQKRSDDALPHAKEAVRIRTQLHSPDLNEAEATLAECVAAATV